MKNKVILSLSLELDIHLVPVLNVPIRDLMTSAGFGDVHPSIRNKRRFTHYPDTYPMALWYPEQARLTIREMGQHIRAMTTIVGGRTYRGRPANIGEGTSYFMEHPKEFAGNNVLLIGETVSHEGKKYFPYIYGDDFNISFCDGVCNDDLDCPLVVFEEVKEKSV